ncbi:hypothetical protein HBH98_250680 [Parastagonospora nodorum]|nr:hypothetical protein HBH98_250680 [Parastagonospora nodorum]KAH4367582.1 hypothetical protein HBH99_250610 [Parastagonospora nodorum]
MCAKNDFIRQKSPLLTSTQTPNHVNTFSLDFAFSFTNILLLIAFIISYRLFIDELNIQQSLLDRATVVLIIISRSTPSTLLARFIPTTKIRNPLLKKNAAKSRILLACADRRTKQCYLTICAILADYEEQVLLTSIKKNRYCTRCTKHYNFNIYVSLATDTLHLLLKGLLNERFCQVIYSTSLKRFNNKRAFTEAIIQQLIAVISPLFVLKAPFALHFIHAVCDLVILAQYKRIQPYLTKLLLSEVAVNIAISNFIHVAALYLILTIIDYTCYDKDRKHIAYIKAFSKVLLFNNNKQINNTTRILTFKFYDLSTIIRLVHLVLRDLPNLITYTTISYYVNNYIN